MNKKFVFALAMNVALVPYFIAGVFTLEGGHPDHDLARKAATIMVVNKVIYSEGDYNDFQDLIPEIDAMTENLMDNRHHYSKKQPGGLML